eukprot:978067-Pyramimonas_sp.AAC.1
MAPRRALTQTLSCHVAHRGVRNRSRGRPAACHSPFPIISLNTPLPSCLCPAQAACSTEFGAHHRRLALQPT